MRMMLFLSRPKRLFALAFVGCLALAGCDGSAVSDAGSAYLTSTAPDDPKSIAETVESLTAEEPIEMENAVVGIVYAGESSPFQADGAAFIMSELPDPEHGDGTIEHLDNCPFCKRRAEKATKAMVEFRDPDGKLLKTGADSLLAIQEGDQVIVSGKCVFEENLNLLVIEAASIHKINN